MKNMISILASAFLAMVLLQSNFVQASDVRQPLPIDSFASLPVINSVSVSPNGEKLAVIKATSKNGDYIVEIRELADFNKKPVRLGADKMLVQSVIWLNDEKILLVFRQILRDGARSYWVNKLAITDADGKGKWLIPFGNNSNLGFSLLNQLPHNKDEILIQADVNRNGIPDAVRMNINTGRTVTVLRGNTKVYSGFITDKDGEIRAASGRSGEENAVDLYARKKGSDKWQVIHTLSPKVRENFDFLSFSDENPNQIYITANRGEDKAGVYLYDMDTEKYSERLFGLDSVDVDGIATNKWGKFLGYTYTTKYPKAVWVDEDEKAIRDAIKSLFKKQYATIVSRSDDDNAIVIRTASGRDPGTYYLLKNKQNLIKIGDSNPRLQAKDLSDVKYISYKTRDGRKTKAYVTIPEGQPPFPAVVLPHGGPWVRDVITFDKWAQLLANQGYIVIQPQYRGSTGYGLEHWIVGDKNWGLTMQDDLDDAAMYLVDKGLAKKDKLAMFGWSYGGFASFVASMRDNNIYQCSIAGAGVADYDRWNAYVGGSNFTKVYQKPTIAGFNPIDHVDKVNIPLLVVHGDIDSRVTVKHSREFVELLEKHGKDYKYIELEDADHFSNTLFYDHNMLFYTEMVNWLKNKCGF